MAFFSAAISLLLLLLLLSLSISSPCVHGSVASDVECTGEIVLNMASCMPFVMVWSKMDKPDGSCCSGVKKLLDTNADCLCGSLKNSRSLGLVFNVTKVSTLPAVCNLAAPPTTACSLPTTTTSPPPASASAPAPGAGSGSGPGSVSFLAPSHSENNHGSSLIPISGSSFVISCALLLLFSRI